MDNKWAIRCTTRKYKPPMDKIPQKEVLQLYIKAGRPLQRCFIRSTTANDYTSDLGMDDMCLKIYIYYRSEHYTTSFEEPLKGFQQNTMYKM